MFNKSAVIVAAMALAQLAAAGINAFIEPASAQVIEAGKPFTITWKPDGGKTVTLTLRKGDSKNLDTLEDIARAIENTGKLAWTPAGDLEKGADYALQIKDDESGEINYTGLFSVNSDVAEKPKTTSTTKDESTTTKKDDDEEKTKTPVPTLVTSVVGGKNSTMTTTSKPSTTTGGSNSTVKATSTSAPSPIQTESGAGSLVRSPIALFLGVVGAALYLQ